MRVVKLHHYLKTEQYDILLCHRAMVLYNLTNNDKTITKGTNIFSSPQTFLGLAHSKEDAYRKYAEYFI